MGRPAQLVLHGAADTTFGRELLADGAVLVQRPADFLGHAADSSLLCIEGWTVSAQDIGVYVCERKRERGGGANQ